ncbi:MAG TPA: prepilin-type N-terminal cleavage/methylation domain-containing protein [Phycisphaerae bacterium]|nr:prepilin-type N-terminal cleavage/methylation domain-containing protein [Phycisphaerae bacterium]
MQRQKLQSCRHQQSKSSAFTLIELLVVIAIISLLVSMLLPSLKTAKALANRVVCSANMRNINLAFGLYNNDWDGWFPLVREVKNPLVSGVWADKLYDGTYLESAEAFNCPSVPLRVFIPDETNGACKMAYGMEWWVGGGDDIGQGHKIIDIVKPANTVLAGENNNSSGAHGYGVHDNRWPVPLNEWGWPDDERHSGVSNILFVDGHVLAYTQDIACSDSSIIWFTDGD